MQLVIAEKPSVARNIAKVLHATNVKDGYLEGKEYLVSWYITRQNVNFPLKDCGFLPWRKKQFWKDFSS